jgi:hypothetical protein
MTLLGILLVSLAVTLGSGSPARAALREVSRDSYPGEISNTCTTARGQRVAPVPPGCGH